MAFLDSAGSFIINRFSNTFNMFVMLIGVVKSAFLEKSGNIRGVALRQVLFTGVEALKVVSVIALLMGAAVIVETFSILPGVGGKSVMGNVLVVVVIRELGPILTAFIVIGRSGTAISTEIGYMVVNHEMQALEMMGINPLRYVVLPRLIGVAVAIACLSFYFNIIALFGGYGVARFFVNYPFVSYITDLGHAMNGWDLLMSGIKCLSFGFMVALVCSYEGFSVRFSFTEIPQATTRAVVKSIYFCFIINILITSLFYI